MKDQTHTSTDSRQAATTATTKRRGRRPDGDRAKTQNEFNNNPPPIDGRERHRIGVLFFDDVAERMRDYCEFAHVSQWAIVNAAIEVFFDVPTDSDYFTKVARRAKSYRTKWTGRDYYQRQHRTAKQNNRTPRQRAGNQEQQNKF